MMCAGMPFISAESDSAPLQLSALEQKVIEVLRTVDYGEVRVIIKNAEIVQIEEKKSIKL